MGDGPGRGRPPAADDEACAGDDGGGAEDAEVVTREGVEAGEPLTAVSTGSGLGWGDGAGAVAGGGARDASRGKTTAENPDFVADYFASSRLHFIGSFRARYESMMVAVAKRCNCTTEDLLRVPPATEAGSGGPRGRHRIIVHVDMDCFFASVASRDSPHLRGKPIAVCHAAGDSRPGTSGAHGGEISSCSYEARAFGVRAGMFLGKARTLCPDLTTVPYDFDAYERVSVIIYALFYGISDRAVVQASSIDEAYLDLTNVFPASSSLSLTPEAAVEEAVRKLRDDIFAQTGCRASAGIGPCKLVARLATSRSKPNGQLRVAAQDAAEFVLTVPVKGLPGIGRRTSARLEEMGIADCGRLRAVPLSTLQQLFGERVGQSFYHVCRGQDGSPVEPLKPRKSIGAEVSWGVRFGADDDGKVVNFLTSIAHEVAARCKAVRGLGSKVTLKVYRKKPNAGPPGKVLGHGSCDILTKSGPVERVRSIDELPAALAEACLKLYGPMKVANLDLRGVGVQCNDIAFDGFVPRRGGGGPGTIGSFFARADGRESPSDVVSVRSEGGPEDGESDLRPVRKRPRVGQREARPEDGFAALTAEASAASQIARHQGWDLEVFRALPAPLRAELLQRRRRRSDQRPDDGPALAGDRRRVAGVVRGGDGRGSDAGEEGDGDGEDVAVGAGRGREPVAAVERRSGIPADWDTHVFEALPTQIQRELLRQEHGASSRPGAKRRPRRAQQTLTQMAVQAKRRGTADGDVDGGDEDGDDDDDDIPSPPSLQPGLSQGGGGPAAPHAAGLPGGVLSQLELQHAMHNSDGRVFADESLVSFAAKLRGWIAETAGDVRSAHAELLRGRLLEMVRRRELSRAYSELRTIRQYIRDVGGRDWAEAFNVVLGDVQTYVREILHCPLAIRPLPRRPDDDDGTDG